MPPSITIRELARLANCSHTTVSLALRNAPKISAANRARIQRLARDHGYTRNAVVSSLMTQLRASRHPRALEKLALLDWWDTPEAWRKSVHGRELHLGICERARELGYDLEEFWAAEPGLRAARLGRILHARGIRGVVVLSKIEPRGRVSLDWGRFSAATNNYTIVHPNLHRTTHHHFQGAMLALRNLRHRGYRRVGYVTTLESEDRINDGWMAGYLAHEYRIHGRPVVPPLLLNGWDGKELSRWIDRHKPDAILGNSEKLPGLLRGLGLRFPQDIGYASLDCQAGDPLIAGIDQTRAEIGRKVVDLVVEQLENNEFGVPARPKTVMVDGVWHDGKSVRATNPSPARRKA